MDTPVVSILIPTYNRAQYVGDAIASIRAQTFADFELIVADDGSTDGTAALLAAIDDPRLRVVRHERNRGIPATRNSALAAARGRYIAWLDSDDVARPTRLAEQVAFLDANPDIALVGTCAGKLRPDGKRRGGTRVPPLAPDAIAAWLLFRSPFQQSSLMGRAPVLRDVGYDPAFPVCEDVRLFIQLQLAGHRLANLPRVLIDRRLHPGQTVRQHQAEIRALTRPLFGPMIERVGVQASEMDLDRHALLGKPRLDDVVLPDDFLEWTEDWLRRIAAANRGSGFLAPDALAMASGYAWFLACRGAAGSIGRARAVRIFGTSQLARGLVSTTGLAWARGAVTARIRR